MKLLQMLSLLAFFAMPSLSHGLTLTEGPMEGAFEKPPHDPYNTNGRMSLAIGGGLSMGFLLFVFWKRRRLRKASMTIILFAALFVNSPHASACANIESTTLDTAYDDYLDTIGWFSMPVDRALAASPAAHPRVVPDPAAYRTTPAPGIRENDEAVRLILKGNAPAALEMLKKIEEVHPGLYATAANLGTCYELTGDDENALKWINVGLERDPYSHMLAEWLHVRVLEAKIALKSDPNWLTIHTICGLDPTHGTFETRQGIKDHEGVLASFRSQCTVRALFIKPQDPVMAQLLYEAATFMLDSRAQGVAGTLALALQYGLSPHHAADLQAKADRILAETDNFRRPSKWGIWAAQWKYPFIFCLALILGFLIPFSSFLKREASQNQ
jgi:hypothetical protein